MMSDTQQTSAPAALAADAAPAPAPAPVVSVVVAAEADISARAVASYDRAKAMFAEDLAEVRKNWTFVAAALFIAGVVFGTLVVVAVG